MINPTLNILYCMMIYLFVLKTATVAVGMAVGPLTGNPFVPLDETVNQSEAVCPNYCYSIAYAHIMISVLKRYIMQPYYQLLKPNYTHIHRLMAAAAIHFANLLIRSNRALPI